MTNTESDIMKDAFYFLKQASDPPRVGGAANEAWWGQMADEMVRLGKKYNNHPLAVGVITAIYAYAEQKQTGGIDNDALV